MKNLSLSREIQFKFNVLEEKIVLLTIALFRWQWSRRNWSFHQKKKKKVKLILILDTRFLLVFDDILIRLHLSRNLSKYVLGKLVFFPKWPTVIWRLNLLFFWFSSKFPVRILEGYHETSSSSTLPWWSDWNDNTVLWKKDSMIKWSRIDWKMNPETDPFCENFFKILTIPLVNLIFFSLWIHF